MFEFSIARKYLIPKRKQLSMSLIALMSISVISLVVWLVLVFLSVTDGIEKNWKEKLTSLNAPIRVTPTDHYYNSYYYLSDSISNSSNYSFKNISEKLQAQKVDPYLADEDMEIPLHWEVPSAPLDLVKELFTSIDGLKDNWNDLIAQDYEVSGALMRLRIIRKGSTSMTRMEERNQGFITQVSYINSFSDKSPYVHSLITSPRIQDLNHLFFLASISSDKTTFDAPDSIIQSDSQEFQVKLTKLLENCTIERMQSTDPLFKLPMHLIPKNAKLTAFAFFRGDHISHINIPENTKEPEGKTLKRGTLYYKNGELKFKTQSEEFDVAKGVSIFCDDLRAFNVTLNKASVHYAKRLSDLHFTIDTKIQGHPIIGQIPWHNLEISKAQITTNFDHPPKNAPPWIYSIKETYFLPSVDDYAGVILPLSFEQNNVNIGDQGFLSFGSATACSIQEQRIPITVCGFYDPGIMAIGAKCILAPMEIVHDINLASNTFSIDKSQANGINLWIKDIDDARKVSLALQNKLEDSGLSPYWNITTFHDYDFARDLLQQFQSDKYLFSLIAVIILTVACCNIISLLVLLVNDKKKEIGILQSMGANAKSIAFIFALCGGIVGILSTLIGTIAAIITLHNIDALVGMLSFLQGHEAFNPAFYGNSLPNELSSSALKFIIISTPIISIIAGLFPALKACKLEPSSILRAE